MTLKDRLAAWLACQPVGCVLDAPELTAIVLAAATRFSGYAQFEADDGISPLVISEDLDVNDGEWALIGDLFALYVERAAASLVEMSRGSGLDQYCRSVTEIEGDIRAMHDDFPRRVFCIPVQTFA